jgi:putative ABC transport system substrate-binding protein
MRLLIRLMLLTTLFLSACTNKKSTVPVIGFIDAFQDNTLAMAKQGFLDALKKAGYDEEKGSMKLLYRNAQGDNITLTQITKYMVGQQPDLIGTCPTLPTISVAQATKDIPIFMMVASTPTLMKLTDSQGKDPINLFGVGENLDYIDTSFGLIPTLIKPKGNKIKVGVIYNQSEPQSVDALKSIRSLSERYGLDLTALPVNSSAEVSLVTKKLASEGIDVFFANPDNTVFAAFESISKTCTDNNIPIITSEAGLVARGALAAYGADMYQWGYQAGKQAAAYLKSNKKAPMHWELVKVRKRVFNTEMAARYQINIPVGYTPLP